MPARIDMRVAQLHGVISEARSVGASDPRWGVYWEEALRLVGEIEALVPEVARPITGNGKPFNPRARLQVVDGDGAST